MLQQSRKLRIISGSHKGRRLTAPKDSLSRPTADRVREALFSILTSMDAVPEGGRVLDCFAGTGALGLEALSRGAGHATFIEHHPAALKVLEINIAALDMVDKTTVIKADAVKPLKSKGLYDLVFLDPPYQKGLIAPCLQMLLQENWVSAQTTFVVEAASTEEVVLPDKYIPIDERRYGAAKIVILKFAGSLASGYDEITKLP